MYDIIIANDINNPNFSIGVNMYFALLLSFKLPNNLNPKLNTFRIKYTIDATNSIWYNSKTPNCNKSFIS